MENINYKIENLMEWAEEVANKCCKSTTYVINKLCCINNELQDIQMAKNEVLNILMGELTNEN